MRAGSNGELAEAIELRKRARELEVGKNGTADLVTAADLMRRSAEMGDSQAQYWYGRYLELGHGVEQNFDSAITYYEKSGKNGFAEAQLKLGILHYRGDAG